MPTKPIPNPQIPYTPQKNPSPGKTGTFGNGLKNAVEAPLKGAGKFWEALGPGFTTGAADDDPSGIATYSQTGAGFGNKLLWLAPFSFPLMAVVQEMCARIGLVTGRGLAGNIKKFYSKKFLYLVSGLLFFANAFNIGADLGAMAAATRLLLPGLNFNFLVSVFAIICASLQIYISYRTYSKYLKWLALILLAYVFAALNLNLDWTQIFRQGIIPHLNFSRSEIVLVCAILGTTISPYLFFWQTSQEVEEEILQGKTTLKIRQSETHPAEIKKMRADVWWGMFFSNLVMFFIIVTTAATLFKNGITDINTASEAAAALKPFAGKYASWLFTFGIIGTGLLAVPVLAGSASYALSEAFGWRAGLFKKLRQAKAFYGTIIAAMVFGLLMNFLNINPIKTLILSAVINGLVAPLILVPIVQLSDNPKLMGNWVNSRPISVLGWIICIIMILVGVATVATLLF